MAAILRPASGTIRVGDTDVTGLRGAALTGYRRHRVGVVFRQGDRSELVYTVEEGEIEVVHERSDGGLELLALLGPGRYFGELGPLFGPQRSATARAVGHVVVTGYSPGDFRDLVGSGRVAQAIMGAGAAEGGLAPSRQARTPPCPGGPEGAK
jgi:CRP-like cAMP-binding protein